jgi:hypothetical protein
MQRIANTLRGRFRLRQTPSPAGLARAAEAWRRLPTAGRLNLTIEPGTRHLKIEELRAAPGLFRFDEWAEGQTEQTLAVVQASLSMTPEHFHFDVIQLAFVKLHALARRFERGRHYDDEAVKTDIAAFARTGDMPMDTHDFVIDVSGGVWVATMSMTMINDRDEPTRMAVARSYFVGGMRARLTSLMSNTA